MIVADQPDCFPQSLVVRVSSKSDGSMLNRSVERHSPGAVTNRKKWTAQCGIDYENVVYQAIVYDEQQTYNRIVAVTAADVSQYVADNAADALYTEASGVGLFLPVADCAATVVYDPVRQALATLHMGRHSTFTDLIQKTITHFIHQGSVATDLIVWMSPSAQRTSYKLEWFNHTDDLQWQGFFDTRDDGYYLDMQGYNRARFIEAGVDERNVHISPVNTMQSDEYFSHANGDTGGRIAVLAYMP